MGQIYHDRAELETYILLLEEMSGDMNPIRQILDLVKPEKIAMLRDQYKETMKQKMKRREKKAKGEETKTTDDAVQKNMQSGILGELVSKPNKFLQGSEEFLRFSLELCAYFDALSIDEEGKTKLPHHS
jgi:hypothetical protein